LQFKQWQINPKKISGCSANAEAVGSNPVEVPKFFFKFEIAQNAVTIATIMSSFKKT